MVLGQPMEIFAVKNGNFLGFGWYAGARDAKDIEDGFYYVEVNRYHGAIWGSYNLTRLAASAYQIHYKRYPKYVRIDGAGYGAKPLPMKKPRPQPELTHSFKATKTRRHKQSIQVGDVWIRAIEN